jgi:multicomponent Na+:H+ antiporter subunit G
MSEVIREAIVLILFIIGALFLLLAATGIVRLPDLFTRMQAATKAATLGVGCTLLAVAVHFSDFGITVRSLLVVTFIFLTAPVAAHLIARAGYCSGASLWRDTVADELSGRYDPHTHLLRGHDSSTVIASESEQPTPTHDLKNQTQP